MEGVCVCVRVRVYTVQHQLCVCMLHMCARAASVHYCAVVVVVGGGGHHRSCDGNMTAHALVTGHQYGRSRKPTTLRHVECVARRREMFVSIRNAQHCCVGTKHTRLQEYQHVWLGVLHTCHCFNGGCVGATPGAFWWLATTGCFHK